MRRLAILMVLSGLALKSETLPIRTYTMADGLAADRVDCIVADSRGFLWFCTPEGLSRFDGYRFINYGADEGLAHSSVATLMETRSGDYFVGTTRGISRINPGGQDARFATSAPSKDAAENNVRALRESQSGKIWCGSSRGLFEWDRASGFRRHQVPLPNEQEITDILEDPRGDLWVGTTGGIYVLRDNRIVWTFTTKDGLPGDWVNTLRLDSKGRMWVASRGGLSFFKQRAEGEWNLEKVYTNKSGLAGNEATALAESSNGILWVGTDWGITRLTLADEPKLLKDITREQGLSDRTITALAEDHAGNMWAGTAAGGVMRIDRLGFTTYREQDGLTTDRVWSVFENKAGGLMAVTITGGSHRTVGIFDGTRFRSVVPKAFGDNASWGYHKILLQTRSGEWWAATKEGLCRFGVMKAEDLDGKAPKTCYSEDSVFRLRRQQGRRLGILPEGPEAGRGLAWGPVDALGSGEERRGEFSIPRESRLGNCRVWRPGDLVCRRPAGQRLDRFLARWPVSL
jgi:ligand-binding sensor domain-containing protein